MKSSKILHANSGMWSLRKALWLLSYFTLAFILLGPQLEAMTLEEAYKALGLNPGASLNEAKAARNKLAKQYHPDRAGNGSLERIQDINSAFDVLKQFYSGAHSYESQSTPQTNNVDPHPKFSWNSNLRVFSASTSVNYPLEEVIFRRGAYERYFAFWSSQVIPDLERQNHYPMRATAYGALEFRWSVIRGTPLIAQLITYGMFAAPMFVIENPFLPAPLLALVITVALEEAFYYTAWGKLKDREEPLANSLNDILRSSSLRIDAGIKQDLYVYDIAESLASNNMIRSRMNKWTYYSRFIRVLSLFPGSLSAFLVRAQAGVGLAGHLKNQLLADLKARPKFWIKQFKIIDLDKLPAEVREGDLITQLQQMTQESSQPNWIARLKIKKLEVCEMLFSKSGEFAQ